MTDGGRERIDGDVAAAAVHGSFCPKLCTFACPVAAATGRHDAVPWSFHRVVADLADERREPDAGAAAGLRACSGCLACRVPCEFDQDVPAQVRAGRRAVAAAGAAVPGASRVRDAVAAGSSPYGVAPVAADVPPAATCVVVPGCRDRPATVTATVSLLTAADEEVAVVPPAGCCGAVLGDLGLAGAAADAADALRERLPGGVPRIALDPHCRPTLEDGDGPVTDLVAVLHGHLEDGRLAFAGPETELTYHDPCLQARREDRCDPVRELLAAAGAALVEPEHTRHRTACSGAGMGMDLTDPDAAGATARARAAELEATGRPAVTACSRARALLADAGAPVEDLAVFLAARLAGT